MADFRIGQVGMRAGLDMTSGSAWGPYRMGVADDDGTPLDLTGATLRAVVFRQSDPQAVLQLLVAVPGDDPGSIDLSLDERSLSRLGALEGCKRDPLILAWALFLTPATGPSRRLFYGDVQVFLGARP